MVNHFIIFVILTMEFEFDTRLLHPYSLLLIGPSGCGKTVYCKNVLDKSSVGFKNIFYFYSEWQKTYETMPNVEFISGMPQNLDTFLDVTDEAKLIVFDDMMSKCVDNQLVAEAFTQKRHHKNVSVILMLQNLFCQGKVMRNIHLNTQYMVLFKNPRDKSQFSHLARQLEPNHAKDLIDIYSDATTKMYGHLLIDLKPETPDALRYRSETINLDKQIVYVLK